MRWLLKRLHEPSTWRGLIWLATALGLTLQPEAWDYITTIGMALAGLLGVLLAEPSKPDEITPPPIDLVGRAEADCGRDPGRGFDPGRVRADDLPVQPDPDGPAGRLGAVRPPIERPLADHLSGGWGDRS